MRCTKNKLNELSISLFGSSDLQLEPNKTSMLYVKLQNQTQLGGRIMRDASVLYVNLTEKICLDTVLHMAKHCANENKIFCCDLSAPFVCCVANYAPHVAQLLPYIDILFGNETDILSMRDVLPAAEEPTVEDSPVHCCLQINQVAAQLVGYHKLNDQRRRIVFVPQVCVPASDGNSAELVSICASKLGVVQITSTIPSELEGRVSVSCGNEAMFAGAVMAQLVNCPTSYETPRELCIIGADAAHRIMSKIGCTFIEDFCFVPGSALDQNELDMNEKDIAELIDEYNLQLVQQVQNPAFSPDNLDFEGNCIFDSTLPGVPTMFSEPIVLEVGTKPPTKRRKRGRKKGEKGICDSGEMTCIVCKHSICLCNDLF